MMIPPITPVVSIQGCNVVLPLNRAIGPIKAVLILANRFASENTSMDFLPAFGYLWKNLVMGATKDRGVDAIISKPARAHRDVAHVAIKHRNCDGGLLD